MPSSARTLSINPVPKSLWGRNLRASCALGDGGWRKLRASLLRDCGATCEICGRRPARWFGHEVWRYSVSKPRAVAKLVGVMMICGLCHACEHFPRTVKCGTPENVEAAAKHYCRVNRIDRERFLRDLELALARWHKLSQRLRWLIDFGPYTAMVAEVQSRPRRQPARLRLDPLKDSEPAEPSWGAKRGPRPMFGRALTAAERTARSRHFRKLRESNS
jgi:hypothetical protein